MVRESCCVASRLVQIFMLVAWFARAQAGHGRTLLEQLAPAGLNYSMIGVDVSNKLYYKASLTAPWTTKDEYLPWSPTAILPLRDGTILAGCPYDWSTYRRSPGMPNWNMLWDSCCVAGLAIMPDGRLVHAGSDGSIWEKTSTNFESNWQRSTSATSGACRAVSYMADGALLCHHKYEENVYVMPPHETNWLPLTDSIALRYVTAYGNMIVGLSSNGGHQLVRLPSARGPHAAPNGNYSSWQMVSRSPPGVELRLIAAVLPAAVVSISPSAYPDHVAWVKMFH